jgi:hypothetical protein
MMKQTNAMYKERMLPEAVYDKNGLERGILYYN